MNCIGIMRETLKVFRRETLRSKRSRRKDHGGALVTDQKVDLQDSGAVK